MLLDRPGWSYADTRIDPARVRKEDGRERVDIRSRDLGGC